MITTALSVVCPGSNAFTAAEIVHAGLVRCPTCARWAPVRPVPDSRWYSVRAHRPFVHPDLGTHGPTCDAATTGECTCSGWRTR